MGALDPNKGLNTLTKREWNLHRAGITVPDPAGIILGNVAGFSRNVGIKGDGYRKLMIDVNLDAGTVTSIGLEVLYWSDDKAAWVGDNPPATLTLTGGSGQWSVEHGGRDCLIAVRAITGGVGAKVNISVRGSWPDNSESA